MTDASFPCPKCGAARSCDHRTVDRPPLEQPQPVKTGPSALQRQAFNVERYRPKRGDGNGLNFRTRKRGEDGRRK